MNLKQAGESNVVALLLCPPWELLAWTGVCGISVRIQLTH